MERSRNQLLELTRCGLWDNEPNLTHFVDGVNWAMVLKLAKEQTLLGVISTAIERLPSSLRPSRGEVLRLHHTVTLNRQYRSHHIKVLERLIELMHHVGVERPVLLKGVGVGMNYPDPSLRQCGDIDLYVGEEHYYRVWDFICKEFGIERKEEISYVHFDFDFMDTHIEIHKYATAPEGVPFHRSEFMAWMKSQLEGDELREVELEGVKVYLPPYNFDFIYIFYHSWRHFLTGGIGLRQLCDWGCYVSTFSDKFDREELLRLIKLFKLHTPISLFATIAVRELGISHEKFLDCVSTNDRRYDKVLDRIWHGGNFGFYRKVKNVKFRNILDRKWCSFRAQFHDMVFMGRIDWIYAIRFYFPFFITHIGYAIKGYKKLGDKL